MKWFLVFTVVALLSFAGVLGGALYFTGNLSEEGLDKLLGRQVATAAPSDEEPPIDDLDSVARALRQREQDLEAKDLRVREQLKRQDINQQDLAALQERIQEDLNQLASAKTEIDADEQARLQETANTIAQLKADKAANTLAARSPQEAAQLLRLMEPSKQTDILGKMDQKMVDELMEIFLSE